MRERLQSLRQSAIGAVERLAPSVLGGALGSGRRLLIMPQELRTADASLASEIAAGTLGLGGATAAIDGVSPFDLPPPGPGWDAALHGFEWLRDLRAAGTRHALAFGRELTLDWLGRHFPASSAAWSAPVTARRLISWLANAQIVVDDAGSADYDRFVGSLVRQLKLLSGEEARAPEGLPRLVINAAILYATLCLSGEEDDIEARSSRLCQELDRQILSDGGHISRNAAALVELLLDFLPLKQCYVARDREPPPRLLAAIRRMIPMLRRMRMGDGSLARFNGVGATLPDALGTVLAFDETLPGIEEGIGTSRYARMQRRQTVLLSDVGPPPPAILSSGAFAGCLAFELYSGSSAVIVNCGAPNGAHRDWLLHARGTPAHSTLVLNSASSSVLGKRAAPDEWGGGPQLEGPRQVAAEMLTDDSGAVELVASHNGYAARFGAIHKRSVRLSPQGDRLEGIDQITGAQRVARRGRELPFAVHFHAHPSARVTRASAEAGAEIALPNGERWTLRAAGAVAGIEESIHLASLAGPVRSAQVVLRGTTADGNAEIRWRLDRIRS